MKFLFYVAIALFVVLQVVQCLPAEDGEGDEILSREKRQFGYGGFRGGYGGFRGGYGGYGGYGGGFGGFRGGYGGYGGYGYGR